MAVKSHKAKNFRRETSAGAVIFRDKNGATEYLVLHFVPEDPEAPQSPLLEKSKKHRFRESWGFPRGQVEKDEKVEETAIREVTEETGIAELKFIPGFKEKIHYFFRVGDTLVSKDVVYFLAKVAESQNVTISREHSEFAWLPLSEALERLTHKNERKILQKADEFLNAHSLPIENP